MRPTVYVVGAGPGDPGLLTLSGHHLLRKADLVLYGRLVSREVLSMASKSAEKVPIHVNGRQAALRLAAFRALSGETVVILKDGDPMVYGRIVDDCLTLSKFGVDCTVVPGVSSITAAAVSAGLPLTIKGSSFTVVSGTNVHDVASIASCVETLVVLMPLTKLSAIVNGLLKAYGYDGYMALVENATRSNEKIYTAKLGEIAGDSTLQLAKASSPAILIASRVSERLENLRALRHSTLL